MKNKIIKIVIMFFPFFLLCTDLALNQNLDSIFVFKESKEKKIEVDSLIYRKAWGFDISASDNGFGLGFFYRYQYSDVIYGFINFSFSEAKDANEVEYYDYWGNKYSPGKKNRIIMMPISAGIQYRLFKDEIVETFKPFLSGAIGPVILFTTPYSEEFFKSLKYGRAHYTLGGYVGFGANFGLDKKNLMGVNVRYYFIPYPSGLESLEGKLKKYFGGIYLTLTFGIMY